MGVIKMALNIPLYKPGEAGDIESRMSPMLQTLMQQRFKPQELEQAMRIHKDNFGLQQAQEGRARQKWEQEQQDRAMLQAFLNGNPQGGGQQQPPVYESYMPSIPNMGGQQGSQNTATGGESYIPSIPSVGNQDSYMPSIPNMGNQESSIPLVPQFQEQGPIPEIGQQRPPSQEELMAGLAEKQESQSGGLSPEKMAQLRANPLLRAMFKKQFGYDPLTETPEQKSEREFNQFKKKEEYKAEHPKASTSGITPEMRKLDYDLKKDSLDERIRAAKERERLADPVEKIKYAKEKAKAEAEKQILVADYKAGLEYKKTLGKEDAKQFALMEEAATQGINAAPIYSDLKDFAISDEIKKIGAHPIIGKYNIKALRSSNDPKITSAIANYDQLTSQLVAQAAKGMNPRFTNKDLELARSMKINDSDSWQAMQQKAANLISMYELGQKRIERAIELTRDNKMSPYQATLAADKEMDGDAFRKDIKDSIVGYEKGKTGNSGQKKYKIDYDKY